jgi:hypothetical protein
VSHMSCPDISQQFISKVADGISLMNPIMDRTCYNIPIKT